MQLPGALCRPYPSGMKIFGMRQVASYSPAILFIDTHVRVCYCMVRARGARVQELSATYFRPWCIDSSFYSRPRPSVGGGCRRGETG